MRPFALRTAQLVSYRYRPKALALGQHIPMLRGKPRCFPIAHTSDISLCRLFGLHP